MIRVEYIRDGLIEEFHEGFVYCSVPYKKNDLNNNTPYYLRSCAKPLQASLLIDYNIDLTPTELAFCSGSHSGEECHIKTGLGILKKSGLSEDCLKCGIHEPLSKTAQKNLIINNEQPKSIHNNCSGKHIGFLAICKKMGWDLNTYYEPTHPLQIEIRKKIYELCEVNQDFPMTTDGCGVPIVSMPLPNIVKGYINLQKQYPQITEAIKQNPYVFGGENRTDTEIIQKTDNLVAKVGACGLCVVLNCKEQQAFVLKINDASYEARRIGVFEIINDLGWGKIEYDNKIKTLQNKIVGEIKVI